MEVWKAIPGFSRYEASTDGLIRSINYKRSGQIRILKPAISEDGYLKTMLQKDDGGYKTSRVHKWVALTFHGPSNGLTVNHKDTNKLNNRPDNLEYITALENVKHATENGLQKPKPGSLNPMAKLTERAVIEIRNVAANGGRYYGRKELAERFGVDECTIKEVVTRRKNGWKHV